MTTPQDKASINVWLGTPAISVLEHALESGEAVELEYSFLFDGKRRARVVNKSTGEYTVRYELSEICDVSEDNR